MPVYEYRCISCEHQFDLWQEIGAEPPPCPECESDVKKIFHPVRTIFKGSGFYITDKRSEQSTASAAGKASDSTSKETSGASSESNNESKSESKSESSSEKSAASTSEPAPSGAAKTESKPA